MFNKNVQGLK